MVNPSLLLSGFDHDVILRSSLIGFKRIASLFTVMRLHLHPHKIHRLPIANVLIENGVKLLCELGVG